MSLTADKAPRFLRFLVFWLFCFCVAGTATGGSVDRDESRPSIVIFPFYLESSDDKEFAEFRDHVEKTVRSALETLDKDLTVVSREDTMNRLGEDRMPAGKDAALGPARRCGADFAIFGSLSKDNDHYTMKGFMWDLKEDRVMVSTDLKVSNIHRLPAVLRLFVSQVVQRIHGSPSLPLYPVSPSESSQAGGRRGMRSLVNVRPAEGPWRSPPIPRLLTSLDIGDLDGDGKNETVFIDESRISIRRFEDGKLRVLAEFSQPPARYLSAEIEDLDGDGVLELIVCSQRPEGIRSSIIRYFERDLKVVTELDDTILATIPYGKENPERILVGQSTKDEEMFSGRMVKFRLEGDKLHPSGDVNLPPGTLVLSYTAGPLGPDNTPLRIVLNQDRRLQVFDRENRLSATVNDRLYGLDRRLRIPQKRGDRELILPGRLLIADTNGDGENELLVVKQIGGSSLIHDLVWDGKVLKRNWKTVTSKGVITDFRVRDFKSTGNRSLVLLLVNSNPILSLVAGPRSVVYAYDIWP